MLCCAYAQLLPAVLCLAVACFSVSLSRCYQLCCACALLLVNCSAVRCYAVPNSCYAVPCCAVSLPYCYLLCCALLLSAMQIAEPLPCNNLLCCALLLPPLLCLSCAVPVPCSYLLCRDCALRLPAVLCLCPASGFGAGL